MTEQHKDPVLAGWIAFYNGKKVEIKKGQEAQNMLDAKKFAVQHFRIPLTKWGQLALAPAYEEGTNV